MYFHKIDSYMASDRKPYTTLPHYHITTLSLLVTYQHGSSNSCNIPYSNSPIYGKGNIYSQQFTCITLLALMICRIIPKLNNITYKY